MTSDKCTQRDPAPTLLYGFLYKGIHLTMSECCKSGFKWTGEPTGKTTKLAGLDTYVAGTNTDRAILIVADIYGWTFKNARILADQYAAETNASVYLPDFFGGEVLDAEALTDSEKRKNFDLGAFIGRNSKEIRFPEIVAATKALRAQGFKKIGAIGFCYGGVSCTVREESKER